MRVRGLLVTVVAAAAGISASNTPTAQAIIDELPINGTFLATSMGDWAKTRDSYHDEASVTSRWTISSSCSDAATCTGQVTSAAGWTAEVSLFAGSWVVRRDIPNWEPCADGTAATGQQTIRFWAVDDVGTVQLRSANATQFAGEDRTVGPSGACGVNYPLVIEMPFTMRKVA